jgi:carboxylate-amine ligase
VPPREPETEALARRLRAVFDRVASFTIGAEEELLLVDPRTLEPVAAAEEALALSEGDSRLALEFRAAQVESITPVCVCVDDVVRELGSVRTLLRRRLRERALVLAVGTHPLLGELGPITSRHRYERIAIEQPWATATTLACGLHVHVAVGGADRALALYNALRGFLPELAALAANTPFVAGRDSGMATARPKLNQAFSRAGVPPAFATWEAYAAFDVWARAASAYPDAGDHWWDLRLHPRHGTLEVRVPDVQSRLDETAAVIALVQALVAHLASRYDAGEALPVHPSERIAESLWLAARDGLGGWLPDLEGGERMRTAERVGELVEMARPEALELGCAGHLEGVLQMVASGGGSARQRRVAETAGLESLVWWLAEETASGGQGLEEPLAVAAG